MCLSVSNWNYITTDVMILLVIYLTFSMIVFLIKSQLSIKLLFITNTVSLIYILITCNLIYIYNQIVAHITDRNANLHIDLKILMNICLVLLIANCWVLF